MKKGLLESKAQKIAAYDPSSFYTNYGLFGLPFTNDESTVVLIPMPWDVTVSYRPGTARGPAAMHEASFQVDLYDADNKDVWQMGIGMEPVSSYWVKKNKTLRPLAEKCIDHFASGGSLNDKKVKGLYEKINAVGRELNAWVKAESLRLLDQGHLVGIVGGEHSVQTGLTQALAEKYSKFSILHIDAHADLREAYEGFEFSHASVEYNASKMSQVDRIVAVGIRDYSEQEADRMSSSNGRLMSFPDRAIKRRLYEGATWQTLSQEIVKPLLENVYVSFDIDALDPALCPHTGTPVPGGLEFEQVFYLLEMLVRQGKKIIGFDLSEVAPGVGSNGEWDAIVGAQALYRLANLMAKSQRMLEK